MSDRQCVHGMVSARVPRCERPAVCFVDWPHGGMYALCEEHAAAAIARARREKPVRRPLDRGPGGWAR